jgi:hypothetical protein
MHMNDHGCAIDLEPIPVPKGENIVSHNDSQTFENLGKRVVFSKVGNMEI